MEAGTTYEEAAKRPKVVPENEGRRWRSKTRYLRPCAGHLGKGPLGCPLEELKAHADPPKLGKGPAVVIERGCYHSNAPLLKVARGRPRR